MKLFYWSIFIVYSIIMLFFTFLPGAGVGNYDKIIHFSAFAVFALLLVLACKSPSYTILITIIVAASTELLQGLVGRETSFFDYLADLGGLFLVMIIYVLVKK